MKRLHAAVFTLAAFSAPAPAADDGKIAVDTMLPALKMHEACMRLEAGEKRHFHWKATAPVDFNIHYHKGPEVFYPVKRNAMRGDGGTFTAKTSEEYCWMWTARNADAKLEGSIDPK